METRSIHVDLDGAWPRNILDLDYFDAASFGPALRFSAPSVAINSFYQTAAAYPADFRLYGSGDFHHLTTLWLRRLETPVVLFSFDNHPDWDARPPRWCCGGWINRALELPNVRFAQIWGCGNFEFEWPTRLFAGQQALRDGRLRVHPWAERLSKKAQRRWECLRQESWRGEFETAAQALAGTAVYVTVDLDCLRTEESATNWENGLFSAADVAWALKQLRSKTTIIGGDVCGAFSPPRYARFFQKLASQIDHPRGPEIAKATDAAVNLRALQTIWPALIGR